MVNLQKSTIYWLLFQYLQCLSYYSFLLLLWVACSGWAESGFKGVNNYIDTKCVPACTKTNSGKLSLVPNHAYALINVSGHVKIPVYPNYAYAVCKTKKPEGLVVPNKVNGSVTGCMKSPVYPNEVYALSKRVEKQQV